MIPSRTDVILGAQWGDEGKGRVVDYYAGEYDVIARFGGGDNAGHTLVVGDRKLALRIVPSGVLRTRPALFIGGGTVVSLEGLLDELEMLRSLGVDISRVKVSDRAHVVFSYHAAADRENERARGALALGTTGRGIGPAYTDKAARSGITFGDLHRKEATADKIRHNLLAREPLLGQAMPREEDVVAQTLERAAKILPHVVDGVEFIHGALERGKRVLAEGAQGTLLDVGYGTYPYVTSSHTIAGGACVGLGIGPAQIDRVVGVVKAYCTRVGGGPFPSELHDAIGDRLRQRGAEFGTVTGRPRRCGWFDAVAARYASRVNGLSSAVLTKLDVLTGLEAIGIVTAYRQASKPATFAAAGEPDLETEVTWVDGWTDDLSSARGIWQLPLAARNYIAHLEGVLGVPIDAVSVGPERESIALT
jgi:adenylosuccinate synthase